MRAERAARSWRAGGVDLVLTGHSHSYERSFLLDGHYGTSGTFDERHEARTPGSGREDDAARRLCETRREARPANEGAVYAVAGSSGQTSGGSSESSGACSSR